MCINNILVISVNRIILSQLLRIPVNFSSPNLPVFNQSHAECCCKRKKKTVQIFERFVNYIINHLQSVQT